MGEQGHHEDRGLCRDVQPIENCPFAGAEGFVTLMADKALLLTRLDTDSAYARVSSGMAAPIRAEYRHGIHDRLLLTMCGSMPRGVSV
jgi:hypothetical protein